MSVWVLRILFLVMSIVGGYAVSQVRPELIENGFWGSLIGFGFGGMMIAVDEMVKGFSLRAFSAASFGLLLGTVIALLIDQSGLFDFADKPVRWLIRLCIYLGFAYIGMILAMRSNKEDFYLIIPFVRFASQSRPESLLVLDTSVIVDGRIADLIEGNVLEGTIVVPRFVLKELQLISPNPLVYRTKANCLRVCVQGPIAVVYPEGTWYGGMTADRIPRFVQEHLIDGKPIEEWIFARNPLPNDNAGA